MHSDGNSDTVAVRYGTLADNTLQFVSWHVGISQNECSINN